jgi:hypothetical protein
VREAWKTPKLVVLARSLPEENMTLGCKMSSATPGLVAQVNPRAMFSACDVLPTAAAQECGPCQAVLQS